MNSQEAKEHFSTADAYYRRARYAEALALLDELNAAFPNTANILFPRARCMRRLGRTSEALQICDVLIKHFKDKRGSKLRDAITEEISRPQTEPQSEDVLLPNMSLDEILGPPKPPALPPVEHEHARVEWLTTPVVVVLAVVAAFVVITVLAMVTGGGEPSTSGTEVAQTVTAEAVPAFRMTEDGNFALYGWKLSKIGWMIVIILVTTVQYTISLYMTLRVSSKLPEDDLKDNLINIGIMSLIGAAMNSIIPCGGFIGSIIMLRRTYELVFIEFFILFAFYVATCIVLYGLLAFAFIGGLLAVGAA